MSKSTTKLRALVAGAGWGRVHAYGFSRTEGVEVAGIWVRTDKPAARELAKQLNAPLYLDYAQALREIKPDLVGVAVQEAGHEAFTVQALESGAHVYCEKVLADSPAAARRMMKAAARAKKQLGVGYNYRYSPSCRRLTELVREGVLGQILFAQLRAFTWCIHHMTDYTLGLLGQPLRTSGFFDDKPLAKLPHKSPPSLQFPTFSYAAYTKKVYTVECKGGAILMAASTDYTSIEEPGATLMVQGSTGRAELDDLTGELRVWRGGRESTIWRPSQIADAIGLENNGIAAASDFARAMVARKQAPIPAQAGLDMILLEEAVMRSARNQNRWEKV